MTNFLIHGYGTGLKIKYFYQSPSGEGAFAAFKQDFTEKEAYVFNWKEDYHISIFQFIQKPHYLYFLEKEKAESNSLLKKLNKELQEKQPVNIVCHSMGCFLLLNYLEKYDLPKSVKKIVFTQGDFQTKRKLENSDLIKRVKEGEITFLNIYCWWDFTLAYSGFLNGYIPSGLFGWKNSSINNKFFPLKKFFNLHQRILADRDFYKVVNS
jgi:hypothetical protein